MVPESIRKIVKRHANKVNIKKRVTPNILRYSFEIHNQKRDFDLKTLKNVYDKAKSV